MASLAEWFVRARRGTSGDMVLDILYDWKKEQEQSIVKQSNKKPISGCQVVGCCYYDDGQCTYEDKCPHRPKD